MLDITKRPMLDVGCRIGPYVAALQERGIPVCALETNPEYVTMFHTLRESLVFERK